MQHHRSRSPISLCLKFVMTKIPLVMFFKITYQDQRTPNISTTNTNIYILPKSWPEIPYSYRIISIVILITSIWKFHLSSYQTWVFVQHWTMRASWRYFIGWLMFSLSMVSVQKYRFYLSMRKIILSSTVRIKKKFIFNTYPKILAFLITVLRYFVRYKQENDLRITSCTYANRYDRDRR